MRKYLPILLALALLLTPCAANAETASSMRLEAMAGTVSATDGEGAGLTVRDGMKLFSGYTLSTQARSYAWLSLDETKALKLDAVSSAAIHQAGRKLRIDLLSGNLLCHVSKPLRGSETLEVHTSTTVTGIRGTILIIKVIDEKTTVIYVLEGEVTVSEHDPDTGKTRKVTVKAGQIAESDKLFGEDGAEGNDVTIRNFTVDEVDQFVRDEIARNPEFAEQLATSDSTEALKLLEGIIPEETTEETPEETAGTATTTLNLTPSGDAAADTDAFRQALAYYPDLDMSLSDFAYIGSGTDAVIGPNQSVTLNNTTRMGIEDGSQNAGTINVDGGTILNVTGSVNNTGVINIDASGVMDVGGTLVNDGVINIAPGGVLGNHGAITNNGTIHNEGRIEYYVIGGGITNNGTIDGSGTIENRLP